MLPTARPLFDRRTVAAAGVISALLLVSAGLGATSAAAEPKEPKPAAKVAVDAKAAYVSKASKISPALRKAASKRQSVFVQLDGSGAADVSADARAAGRSKSSAQAAGRARRAELAKTTAQVTAAARKRDAGTRQLFSTRNAIPGVGLITTRTAIKELAKRPDIVKISLLSTRTINNAGVAQLTKAVNVWRDLGVTGAGVRIGVIDTGIDYTHADFGGPGTVAAYQAAKANNASWTPTAKVVGGYDFVGDDYNADPDDPAYHPVPAPDPNPLDCEGHGTHVAGTAAGIGVNADGTTFTGSYAGLGGGDLYGMRIGPGMAPKALLYALKVFGCAGGTELTIPALDWALDPNGDDDFSDHLDIVNMSLGSDFLAADDPETAVVDNVSAHGVMVVIAAGNSGDLTDAGGPPGSSVRALTTASGKDEYELHDGLRVNAPPAVAGVVGGQASVAYLWTDKPDVTGDVATLAAANNKDGCDPLSAADAARVAGKVAWLEWDDNDATRRCGSAARSANVLAAGAIGALFTSTRDTFEADITGSTEIPVFQLLRSATEKLRPAATAGTLNVTFSGSLLRTVKDILPGLTDTLSSFSSRGVHGRPGVIKPDVTGVGETVVSAGVGTGNDSAILSGTSMASPGVAGISALVLARHPSWRPEQIKAAVMNTAVHDLYTGENRTGLRYGPNRVGAGRVDAAYATTTSVLAYNTSIRGAVSVSFGAVEAPATKGVVTKSQYVRISNTASAPTGVSLRYDPVVRQPGVSYSVSPTAISLRGHSSKSIKVTMTIRTARLRKTIDPTMATTQLGLSGNPEARQYVSDASGRLLVRPVGRPALRVPVYGAAKPVSRTQAIPVTLTGGQRALELVGAGFSQGGNGSTAFQSKVSVLTLGNTSGKVPACVPPEITGCVLNATAKSADLRYVGAGATADGNLWFGLTTWGNWATIGYSTVPVVDIDVNGDGDFDYQARVVVVPDTDLVISLLIDSAGNALSYYPVNFLEGDTDTNVFDTDTLLLPVSPADIGLTGSAASYPIRYRVGTESIYADSSGVFDLTPWIDYDVANPPIRVAAPLYLDQNGTAIPYTTASAASAGVTAQLPSVRTAAKTSPAVRALVLHLNGKSGQRAEVLRLRP